MNFTLLRFPIVYLRQSNPYCIYIILLISYVRIFLVWKERQAEQIQKLKEQIDILKTIEDLSTEVAELTASLLSDSKILDVAMLPKVNTDNDLHSMVPPESQVRIMQCS